MRHLPGPWHVNINRGSATVCAVDHGKSIQVATFGNKKLTHEANAANATICAAAPDMLMALELMRDTPEVIILLRKLDIDEALFAALAKAHKKFTPGTKIEN